ncbi:MAG TPA: HAD-IA family hydrolase [Thermoanaerobaculia bacterium]|nr:HAD-IA family hydrolase [Thermoanaerobaculia bacterium]
MAVLSFPSPRASLEAITFDATGTLFHSPRLGEIYSEILGRHGIEVEAETARRLVREVWQELACLATPEQDRFTSHPEGARGWWLRFVERFAERLEAPPPSRFAAAELFARFARADAWEVYPEVPVVLAELGSRGLQLAVISNWDERLPGVLAGLGLADSFAAIVTSGDAGVEKPDRRIFEHALELLGTPPERALHVGDSQVEDVEGAQAAGLSLALRLDRTGRKRGDLRDLTGVLKRVSAGR